LTDAQRIPSSHDAAAQAVEARIETTLRRKGLRAGHDIHAQVFGGRVRLEGIVNGMPARRAAELAAWGVAGVIYVENRLRVETPRNPVL